MQSTRRRRLASTILLIGVAVLLQNGWAPGEGKKPSSGAGLPTASVSIHGVSLGMSLRDVNSLLGAGNLNEHEGVHYYTKPGDSIHCAYISFGTNGAHIIEGRVLEREGSALLAYNDDGPKVIEKLGVPTRRAMYVLYGNTATFLRFDKLNLTIKVWDVLGRKHLTFALRVEDPLLPPRGWEGATRGK